MMVTRQRFEELVDEIAAQVMRGLPPHLRAEAETVLLLVEDAPTSDHDPAGYGDLLGLYEGIPLVERGADGDVLMFPDRITLFYQPLVALSPTEPELRQEIRITLLHELGHFFGFDEDELEARGLG